MKGIVHFSAGIAATSCLPWAVESAQSGHPAWFILGAVAGLLPDTLDFKILRYFYRFDVLVQPDSDRLDPQPLADAAASAISSVAAGGAPVRIKFCTQRIGMDGWRQYRIRFDSQAGEVRAQFGPVVSTGQTPQPGTLPAVRPVAISCFTAPGGVQLGEDVVTVDVLDGPSFLFQKTASGAVEGLFLPWHRNGSHSFVMGALVAGVISFWSWRAAVVWLAAHAAHVLADQAGHLGSALWFPFRRRRISGLRWMHSGDALPNFAAVWLCGALTFWNLYAAVPDPITLLHPVQFAVAGCVVPFLFFGALRRLLTGGRVSSPAVEWQV